MLFRYFLAHQTSNTVHVWEHALWRARSPREERFSYLQVWLFLPFPLLQVQRSWSWLFLSTSPSEFSPTPKGFFRLLIQVLYLTLEMFNSVLIEVQSNMDRQVQDILSQVPSEAGSEYLLECFRQLHQVGQTAIFDLELQYTRKELTPVLREIQRITEAALEQIHKAIRKDI